MMARPPALLPVVFAVSFALPQASSAQHIRHAIELSLDPAAHRLTVTDTVTIPAGQAAPADFLLHAALEIRHSAPAVVEVPLGDTTPFFGNNGGSGALDPARVKRYRFTAAPQGSATVSYSGIVHTPLSAREEEYARGFRDTPGLIGPQGAYLAGSTFWYPHLSAGLITFALEATVPEGWHLVSQGTGTSRDAGNRARWSTQDPMDEIYLVGGPLTMWRDTANGQTEALAYLHEADEALARKYLDATAQYIGMYRSLIGPYPYAKFALVENFWETGYGMPSFTLLGPQIVRFPFILASSYPHEILHNWWGNGVFVDYETGNWSEGLTAYLADHLIQEQRGNGATYRRTTLQKYRDYVTGGRDFALTEFRSRHSAATEAVGYGKMLMGAHMLRRAVGDQQFVRFLQRFYRDYRGKVATFADLRRTAEAIAGRSLEPFLGDWIERRGAPALSIADTAVTRTGAGWRVTGVVVQAGDSPVFHFPVPVVIQAADGTVVRGEATMTGHRSSFSIETPTEPAMLLVDPEFDVFRRLDHRETPPTLSMLFGAPRVTAIIAASDPDAPAYREMLKAWSSPNQVIDVVTDAEVTTLPADRSVWLLGAANRLAAALAHEPRFVASTSDWRFAGETLPLTTHAGVVVVRHPSAPASAVGWIVGSAAALPGLARKLPHYGRYSYLGFEGTEPTNTLKGEWTPDDSPLRVELRPVSARSTPVAPLRLEPRKALVDLPPAFSTTRLGEHVAFLASPEREGRVPGSTGLEAAAAYVERQFTAIGLTPAGSNGYRQPFSIPKGPDGRPVETSNLIGLLPGTKAELAQRPLIVSAHYDHLGTGWPDAHAGERGRVHPGADDNASGVAVLLELARAMAASDRPQRPVYFVAFSGEEAGLAGAKHFADHAPVPVSQVSAVVNLDTVGRLRSGRVQVLGAGTATEWPHIFRGASFVTGIESAAIAGNAEASDQWVFIQRGIPAVQIFTGPHEDYHRAGDTADKIDLDGMVKVTTLVREAAVYLAGRVEPLTATIQGAAMASAPGAGSPAAPTQARRVTFGAVPDFAFEGPGVRLSGVSEGSPAAEAGLRAGDVLVRLDGRAVASLAEFSGLLKTLTAGQVVKTVYRRDGVEHDVNVKVAER